MRYEDASGSFQASGPNANDDSDTLSAGSRQAATGNLITGEGTQYGAAGADSAAGGHITSIAGKGGEDSSFAGGKLGVTGEHGSLSVDAEGNYNYIANKGAPENVRDRFIYTLADNQGNSDTAALVIELGKTPVVIKADAQQVVPGPDGVVTLPPGVELSDVMVVGRNLVINMPDGTQLIIVDGAIFVPQLVLDGVQVPATNVAALLIGQEPQPAAGELPPSSGGNFALPPPPLDPGVPLGDLIPPTVRDYTPPEPQEVFEQEEEEPTITIEPDGQPATVNAVDGVEEGGLPDREGGHEGSGEEAAAGENGDPSEATSGVIHIDSPDEPNAVTINGEAVTNVGQEIQGTFGILTITSISPTEIGYIYTLTTNIDHTDGVPDQDDFSVTVTDDDGDQATATLTINIADDEPEARNDVDSVFEGGPEVADGNVLTGSGGVDANDSDGVADTFGADDAELQGFSQGANDGTLGAPFVAEHGTLVLNANGSYTYTLDSDDPAVRELGEGDTLTEVFTYQIIDGDGDVSTATLTITIVGTNEAPTVGSDAVVVSEEGLVPNGIEDDVGSDDTTNSPMASGNVPVSDADGDPLTVTLGAPAGSFSSNNVPIVWALSNGGHTLTGTAGEGGDTIITITIDDNGDYNVLLSGPIDHDIADVEDDLDIVIPVSVSDGKDMTTGGSITVTIEDDSPTITAGEFEPELLVDETDLTVNETQNFSDVFSVLFGADGGDADSTEYALGINAGDTGLFDTATDEAVILTMNNGVVEGRTAVTDVLVLTVSVNDDGDVTIDQLRAVVHPDDTNPDDPISLANDDLITLTAIVTDNDGDSSSETIGIGDNIVLEDDGPDAFDEPQQNIPEGQTIAGTFDFDPGADGATVTHINGVPLVFGVGGFSQWIVVVGGQIRAQADGSYLFEADASGSGVVSGNFTVTDGDGDPDTATWAFNITDANSPTAGISEARLDDDGLTGPPAGNPASTTGDIDAKVGEVVANPSEAIFHGLLTLSFGGDGPGTVTFAAMDGLSGTVGTETVLYSWAGSTLTATVDGGARDGTVLFDIVVNQTTGGYTLTLRDNVLHAAGGDDETSAPKIALTYTVTDSDNSPAGGADGTLNIEFNDDAPTVTVNANVEPNLEVDESDFTTDAGPTSFAGLFDVNFGADGPAATNALDFELNIDTGDTGLVDTLTGEDVILVKVGETIEGRTDTTNALVFIISVNADGEVSLDQQRSVVHPDPSDPNESITLAADSLITLSLTATDGDGDSHTVGDPINIAQNFIFFDDSPAITSAENINIENSGDIAHTGAFQFDLGADGAPLGDDVFSVTGSATVNGVAVTNWSISETSENASFAIYAFSFDYPVGGGLTAHETGTLTFDKALGTYTVDLANPIAGISVDSVQNGQPPTFYDVDQNGDGDNTDAADNAIVAVVEIASDLFIQFTGQSDVTTPASGFGNDDLWGGGTPSEVKISSTSIGVFGNSVQDSDMLDYNFYETDPGAAVGMPTASAGVAFIKVSQFNGAEDFVITLKLADPNNIGGTMIERTFVINADDVLTVAPPGYPPLTNGTGFIIFEPNDYRSLADVPDNYEIVGMQLRSSTEGVQSTVGEVYNFDGDLGQADVSATTFGPPGGGDQGTNDNDVFKIVDIGVVRVTTTDQEAELTFNVTIQDGDNDTDSLTLTATVTADPDGVTTIDTTSTPTAMPAPVNSAEFAFVSTNENERLTGGQGNTGIIAGIVAAAGMMTKAAAAPIDSVEFSDHQAGDLGKGVVGNAVAGLSDGMDSSSLPMLDAGLLAEELVSINSRSSSLSEPADASYSVDGSPARGTSAVESHDRLAVDEGSAASSAGVNGVAPTVNMPSAEALQAIASGNPQAGSSVEQVAAAALDDAGPSPIDALLANLPGGHDGLEAIAHLLIPVDEFVSGWPMAQHKNLGAGYDGTSKIDVESFHHDAVQPTANG